MKFFICFLFVFVAIFGSAQTSTCAANLQMTCDQKKRKQDDIKRDSVALSELELQVEQLKARIKSSHQVLCTLNEDEKGLIVCVANEQRVQAIGTAKKVLKEQYESSLKVLETVEQTKTITKGCPPGVNCN